MASFATMKCSICMEAFAQGENIFSCQTCDKGLCTQCHDRLHESFEGKCGVCQQPVGHRRSRAREDILSQLEEERKVEEQKEVEMDIMTARAYTEVIVTPVYTAVSVTNRSGECKIRAVMLLDKSGSMNTVITHMDGEGRLVTEGLTVADLSKTCVKTMHMGLRDNGQQSSVVSYNTHPKTVVEFKPPASPLSASEVCAIDSISCSERTNIIDAVRLAVSMLETEGKKKRNGDEANILNVIIGVSDGRPNVNSEHNAEITEELLQGMSNRAIVIWVGVGVSCDGNLLTKLANGGFFAYVNDQSTLMDTVANIYAYLRSACMPVKIGNTHVGVIPRGTTRTVIFDDKKKCLRTTMQGNGKLPTLKQNANDDFRGFDLVRRTFITFVRRMVSMQENEIRGSFSYCYQMRKYLEFTKKHKPTTEKESLLWRATREMMLPDGELYLAFGCAHSRFVNVGDKHNDKWCVRGRRHYIFSSEEEAARAADKSILVTYGQKEPLRLNFPEVLGKKATSQFRIGERVAVNWGKKNNLYKGTVVGIIGDTLSIKYDVDLEVTSDQLLEDIQHLSPWVAWGRNYTLSIISSVTNDFPPNQLEVQLEQLFHTNESRQFKEEFIKRADNIKVTKPPPKPVGKCGGATYRSFGQHESMTVYRGTTCIHGKSHVKVLGKLHAVPVDTIVKGQKVQTANGWGTVEAVTEATTDQKLVRVGPNGPVLTMWHPVEAKNGKVCFACEHPNVQKKEPDEVYPGVSRVYNFVLNTRDLVVVDGVRVATLGLPRTPPTSTILQHPFFNTEAVVSNIRRLPHVEGRAWITAGKRDPLSNLVCEWV